MFNLSSKVGLPGKQPPLENIIAGGIQVNAIPEVAPVEMPVHADIPMLAKMTVKDLIHPL